MNFTLKMAPEEISNKVALHSPKATYRQIKGKLLHRRYFFLLIGIIVFLIYVQNANLNLNIGDLTQVIPPSSIKEFLVSSSSVKTTNVSNKIDEKNIPGVMSLIDENKSDEKDVQGVMSLIDENKGKGIVDDKSHSVLGSNRTILYSQNDSYGTSEQSQISDNDAIWIDSRVNKEIGNKEAVDKEEDDRHRTKEDSKSMLISKIKEGGKGSLLLSDAALESAIATAATTLPSSSPEAPLSNGTKLLNEKSETDVPLLYDEATKKTIPPTYKTIAFFTNFFGGTWDKYLRDRRIDLAYHGCPVTKCAFTFNPALASSADAVIFHAPSFNPDVVPRTRSPHQRYIWLNVETPCLDQTKSVEDWHGNPGFFNWTATYLRDSEVLMSYGGVVPINDTVLPSRLVAIDRNSSAFKDYMKALERGPQLQGESGLEWEALFKRPKLIAWMVSHCHTVSGREFYAQELQEYVSVDVFGKCGTLKCGKNHLDTYCYKDVLRPNYKFYLAFENSWCSDYVTEKLWYPLMYGVVPVVFGGANYDDFLPPHSYIDATNLTPMELGQLLTRIAASKEEYASYHLWREYWRVLAPVPMCDICTKLHSDTKKATIPDLGGWWSRANNCSTKYPESQYPRPSPAVAMDYLKLLGSGLDFVNKIFKDVSH